METRDTKQVPPLSGEPIKAGCSAQSTINRRHLWVCGPCGQSRAEMRGFTLSGVCQCGLFTYLLFFSLVSFTAAVSFDLTELRNKVAKIKVNPRGNLWATGKSSDASQSVVFDYDGI